MGFLRLTLALSVVLAHFGGFDGFFLIGGAAPVQIFYIISGFYIGLILNEKYNVPALNKTFYINRILRIYVIYYIYIALALSIDVGSQFSLNRSPLSLYHEANLGIFAKIMLALSNITILGQDWLLYLRTDHGSLLLSTHALDYQPQIYRFALVPPAWSLSLELMFYSIAPFVARRSVPALAALAAISMGCRVVGIEHGLYHDPWSYRFFPFELSWFLAGVISYKAFSHWRTALDRYPARLLVGLVPLAICSYPFFITGIAVDSDFSWPRLALLLAVATALPALHALTNRSRLDRSAGELSYPIYLGHFSIVLAARKLPLVSSHPLAGLIIVFAATIGMAMLVVRYVDVPLDRLRQLFAERARQQVLAVGRVKIPPTC